MASKIESGSSVSSMGKVLQPLRNRMLNSLDELQHGEITVKDPFGTRRLGSANSNRHELRIQNHRFYLRILLGGSIALGESYADGWWETDDLPGLLGLFCLNRDQWVNLSSYNPLSVVHSLVDWMNENSLTGARRNIQEHYDLGNDFYEQILDETMTYSSAIYEDESDSLREAQLNKLDRVCRELDLHENRDVLEIGSGWGSFAVYAAENYGAEITTTTISEQQFDHVTQLVRERGIDDRVNVLKQDYRELDGEYDRIVSLEMIEAVGEEYLSTYFRSLDDLLADGGEIFLQGIHMRDQFYEEYRNTVDFIQRYIFPGGHLPSLGRITEELSHTDLAIKGLKEIGDDYVRTLETWRKNFLDNRDVIQDLGFDDYFMRLWDYYFSYCQAGFATGLIGDFHLRLESPSVMS